MIPDELSGGPHFAAYSQRYIRHTKGRWAGQPLIFEDWQREFWWEALEVDPRTGLRIYSEVGLGLPRKNTKSTMSSAIGIYLLDADGENEPEVYCAAAARDQAGIVLGQSRSMVQRSPMLLDRLVVRRYRIECPRNGGVMRSLSADAPLQHGLNPSANIIDELHAHKNPDLYTALTTGTGAREQPFTIWISTAGGAGEGILSDIYESMFMGSGELEVRGSLTIYRDRPAGVLIYWYGAPRDADIADPDVWMACNPISWLHDGDYLRKQYLRLMARGAVLEWRRYHLNQFTGSEEAWLPEGAWANGNQKVPLNPLLPIGVGIDRNPDGTLAAICLAQRQGDRVIVEAEVFPAEAASGHISSEAIRQRLRALRVAYPRAALRDPHNRRPLPGPAYAYDKVAFGESAEMLDVEGLNMVDMPMTPAPMAPPSTLAYEMITQGRLLHGNEPILREHVANTTALLTDRGMKVMRSKITQRPNVAAVAMVRAVAMCMQEAPPAPEPEPPSVVTF